VDERLSYLFNKQLAGDCSSQEKRELVSLLADQRNDADTMELLKGHWNTFDESAYPPVFEAGQSEAILSAILRDHVYPLSANVKSFKLWPRILIAATVTVAFLMASLYVFNKPQQIVDNLGQEIMPAKSGATLTLANGRKINLSLVGNGQLAKEAGVAVTKTADGKLIYHVDGEMDESNPTNTITTSKGETFEVHLPDGSTVKLNAASSLTFSVSLLKQGKRMVSLVGEGFFQVAKDKAHPFIVQGKGQQVEVLGTQFNMNTYADEPFATTTLLEGSVLVTAGKKTKKIKPGEQASSNSQRINIHPANLEQVMSWTKGDFHLNHVNFKIAMREIARWYDVEVIYDVSVPNDMESGGWVARDNPLSTVLKSIESSGLVKFIVKDRKIYVTR
jgi:transmembrane sensor